ncbi:hypothetical protein BDA99DRAFT_609419 [Phascolomyces articulosus]|uniref:Uncharacterized protein n=1 Tax=Phascolomyces articulosus TaxID=60185 RepID=A0AAD5JZG7_9FUNG|nr:hypothetical protein BDA99DRAFT_609419 [Phascolomyces articulosus]
MLYTGRSKVSQLGTTSYFDLQQQQQPDEEDDEESALYIKRNLIYGTTEETTTTSASNTAPLLSSTTSSSPPSSPPPPPTMQSSGRCSRSGKREKLLHQQQQQNNSAFILDDFVLPALDPNAQEVTAATKSSMALPSASSSSLSYAKEQSFHHSWFMRKRKKPAQVNLSTIRSNYRICRKRARDDNPKVYGFIDDIKQYFQFDAYISMIQSILWANQTIVLFVNLDLLVDLLLCCAYLREIIQGYDIGLTPYWLFKNRSYDLWVFCQILSLWNIGSFAIRFLISRSPCSVLISFRGLIELLTSVPLLVSKFLPHGQYIYVPYFLRSWVCVLRTKSALKIKVTLRMTDKPVDAINYKQIYLVGMTLTLLFNGMAAFQYTEAIFGGNHYSVLDSLYFVFVTLSTVGYGDITPIAATSRAVIMLLICITVAVIPGLVSDFMETMQKRDAEGSVVEKGTQPFILIVGSFTAEQAKDTLDGFLNMDNIDGKLSVVFLDTKPITDDLKLLGRNSVWGHRVQFLHSTCLNDKALQRANARYAQAIFTLSDLNAPNPMKEDEHNTVRLWSLYCYTARYDVPIYSYNLSPSTAIYQKVAKEVICTRQFNQYLLALNCRCRGASTLLTNLLHQREPLNDYDLPWEAQYDDGSCNEIYTAPASACIVGISFCHAAWILYNENQVILFAVKAYIPEQDRHEIILNPSYQNSHIIKETDLCFYIAQSLREIHDIDTLSPLYVWQMVRLRTAYSQQQQENYNIGSMTHHHVQQQQQQQQQQMTTTTTPPPYPSSSSSSSSSSSDDSSSSSNSKPPPPSKKRYQITRLPSASRSLLIGISGGGAALNISKLPYGRYNTSSGTLHDNISSNSMNDEGISSEDDDDEDEESDDNDEDIHSTRTGASLTCYLLEEPAKLSDAIIQSAIGMHQHVLVCMHEEFINLFKFIYNLRSPHLRPEELQDIIILCNELPSEKEFEMISNFPRVYIMEGNCRQPDDLHRAGIKRAKQVVVMSEKDAPELQGASADSAAIMTSHIIHLLLHGRRITPYIIVNLVERSNIKFMHLLQGKQVDEEVDVFYTPAYAAGDVVADSLISNVLLSQSYYKPDIVKVIKALSGMPPSIVSDTTSNISAQRRSTSSRHSKHVNNSKINNNTNNNHINNSTNTSCWRPTSHHQHSNDLDNLFEEYRTQKNATVTSSRLSSIPVPNLFVGQAFSHLYESLLLDQGVLALGLLRAPDNVTFGNELPFVYSNPVPSLILRATDFVYVLAQPGWMFTSSTK